MPMIRVTLAEAEKDLDTLLDQVETGETVEISRDGKPVALLVATEQPEGPSEPKKPFDLARLKALQDSLPRQEVGAGDFIPTIRAGARY